MLGYNGDAKNMKNRNNGTNLSATGTLLLDRQKIMANNFKYYSDISDISSGILGTIHEKVNVCSKYISKLRNVYKMSDIKFTRLEYK